MTRLLHWFYKHQTFGMLGVLLTVLFGLYAVSQIRVQLMPEYVVNHGIVEAKWPGVSPEGMDAQVGRHLDATVSAVTGVDKVYTTSYPGGVYMWVELERDADKDLVLDVIERRITTIPELPRDMDPPTLTRPEASETAGRLVVYGPLSETAMEGLGDYISARLRDAGLSRFTLYGHQPRRWKVEVDPVKVGEIGIGLREINQSIWEALSSSPAFRVNLEGGRSLSVNVATQTGQELRKVDLGEHANGLKLEDVATIQLDPRTPGTRNVFRSGQGFFFEFERGPEEDALELTEKLDGVVSKLREELPSDITLQLFDMEIYQISDRLWLLAENGIAGLILVMLSLYFFVGLRSAFWVGIGLVSTFSIAFGLMWMTGQTINMVSAFTMVMVIGLLVDDSIVVAESIERYDGGFDGVTRTSSPVFISSVTTIAAFAPVVMLQEEIGAYVTAIPAFVCAAIVASLIECYVLMPNHMGHKSIIDRLPVLPGRKWGAKLYAGFLEVGFRRFIAGVWRRPSFAIATGLALLALAVGLMASNTVRFKLWDNPKGNFVFAHVTLAAGEDPDRMDAIFEDIWEAADLASARFETGSGSVLRTTFGVAGRHMGRRGRNAPENGSVLVELLDSDGFRITPDRFVTAWREEYGAAEEGITVEFGERQLGLRQPPVSVNLRSDSLSELRGAGAELAQKLRQVEGLTDIRTGSSYGQASLTLRARPDLETYSDSPAAVLADVNQSLRGLYASRSFDTGEEIKWHVGYRSDLGVDGILQSVVRDTTLYDLVDKEFTRSQSRVRRREGYISETITAQIEDEALTLFEVKALVKDELLPQVEADYDINPKIEGQVRAQDQTLNQVILAFVVGILLIYGILAVALRSFGTPFLVISILPFGAAGMVLGHFLMGMTVTLLSLVALVGLMGVIVNDSVLLIDEIKRRRAEEHLDWAQAVLVGYSIRLRAVLLTSATTVLGLLPLLIETSYQAQFLIPIAITISFGLVAATLGSLILIPAGISIFGRAD